jgi:proline iminopeptidase
MQGPNEWSVTGTLKNWNRWSDLLRISTKTLVMGAKYDEASPDDLLEMADLMGMKYDPVSPGDVRKMPDSRSKARAWISGRGSHFTMYHDQLPYFTELLTFLKS